MNFLVSASLTATNHGGVVEGSNKPVDTVVCSGRYSFSLKRFLNLETHDNTSRKKGGKPVVSIRSIEANEPVKLGCAASKKGSGCRHEYRKGDLDPPIIIVVKEIGNKVVTCSRLKNSELRLCILLSLYLQYAISIQ
jgi:hypothetical protein